MTATTEDPLSVPAPDLDVDALHALLLRQWGFDGQLTPLHGERDRNFRVDTGTGRILLKVHNAADGEPVLDLQTSALQHIGAVAPDLPVCAVVPTSDGRAWTEIAGRDGRRSLARVLTWLDGRHPAPEELDEPHLRAWGRTTARLGQALRGFVHPAAAYPIAWDIRRLPQLRPWLSAVDDDRRPLVEAVLDQFEQQVTPRLRTLRAQVVHNDLAPTNVLVDASLAITGITDFGDMTHTALVCDLAVAAADVLSGRNDGVELASAVIAGYHEVTPLEATELALVADLMAGRYAAAIIITAWRAQQHGSAPPVDASAFRQLAAMLDSGLDGGLDNGLDALSARLARTAGSAYVRRPTRELQLARTRVMGAQELSYEQPLHLVSGRGVFVEDADGRHYLDAYNNVAVLGHSHPVVADAVGAQLSALNTNTRYLQDAPVTLAEQLLATLPERFDRVLLVNSGSEANDLAWRIARHATGAAGGIATAFAYHGVTEATFALSPEAWRSVPPPAHIRLVAPPPGSPTEIAEAVRELDGSDHGLAAMIVDGVFTSDGILGPAHDWTRAAATEVHASGGIYIADEVQAGHGRIGECLWSFVAGDIPADIVTLGKPMGNGYPIAAVIGTSSLIDSFVEGTDYFSTFGGGTAACVAALAVLRTIHDERILDRVTAVGERLRAELRTMCAGRADVAEVRGWGLAIGVAIVDPATGMPDPARTRRVVDGMRQRGILIGRTGPHRSTLKIRPPLVFGHEHIDLLTSTLEVTLQKTPEAAAPNRP